MTDKAGKVLSICQGDSSLPPSDPRLVTDPRPCDRLRAVNPWAVLWQALFLPQALPSSHLSLDQSRGLERLDDLPGAHGGMLGLGPVHPTASLSPVAAVMREGVVDPKHTGLGLL